MRRFCRCGPFTPHSRGRDLAFQLLYRTCRTNRYRNPSSREHVTQNDNADRNDIDRLADDGCPNTTGDSQSHDLSKLLAALGKDEG